MGIDYIITLLSNQAQMSKVKITKSTKFTIAALAVCIVAGFLYWRHEIRYPSTEDAYIDAHVIQIAPQITGDVDQVSVHNQQHVTKNQLLFTIDDKPFQIAYEKAEATLSNTQEAVQALRASLGAADGKLAQANAELINAEENYQRIHSLTRQGYYAKSGDDIATRQLKVAKAAVMGAKDQLAEINAKLGPHGEGLAQIQAAQTAVDAAKLNLQYTKITAPESGYLAQLKLQHGQTVTAYQPLFSLVSDNHWWANANMKETDLTRIHAGQKATIAVDMYPNHIFQGIVQSISAGSGSTFSLLPAENASGNWVKVTQRFPVRVRILNPDSTFPLRVGASCTVTIDTESV